jgi:hypothetical protein
MGLSSLWAVGLAALGMFVFGYGIYTVHNLFHHYTDEKID